MLTVSFGTIASVVAALASTIVALSAAIKILYKRQSDDKAKLEQKFDDCHSRHLARDENDNRRWEEFATVREEVAGLKSEVATITSVKEDIAEGHAAFENVLNELVENFKNVD